MRTSLAWVRLVSRSVVVSRAARRLKERGSRRTDTRSVPPRGTPPPVRAPVDAGAGPHAALTATAAISAAAGAMLRASLVNGCLAGQQTGRLKMRAFRV